MNRIEFFAVLLTIIVLIESSVIAYPLIRSLGPGRVERLVGSPENYSFGYSVFNQPISNNTDIDFRTSYNGSWVITIRSSLRAPHADGQTEAQMAFAPHHPVEAKSIPTIIVQERDDGLLRIEYFAQAWPNTYGLVLYNSTFPGWIDGNNVTLRFVSLGRPSVIDPQIAPRSNGNLTITVGRDVVSSNYPIAWASLAEVYLYGLPGSSFTGGNVSLTIQALAAS